MLVSEGLQHWGRAREEKKEGGDGGQETKGETGS